MSLLGKLGLGESAKAAVKTKTAGELEAIATLRQQGRGDEAIVRLQALFAQTGNAVAAYRLVAALLNAQRFADVVAVPAARPHNARDWALAEVLLNTDVNAAPALALTAPATPELALVTMVKDEEDILAFNLTWHYALGVRRFFVIDNASRDATRVRVQAFADAHPDAQVLVLDDPVVAHLQGRKVTGAMRFALSLWPDVRWVLLVDADEFVCTEAPLAPQLAQLPPEVDALVLPKSVYRLPAGGAAGAGLFFEHMCQRQPLGHASAKIIARASLSWEVAQGNHRFFENGFFTTAQYAALPGVTMREYPLRSVAQMQRKVAAGSRAITAAREAGLRAVGGDHWVALAQLQAAQGDAALTLRLHTQMAQHARAATVADPLPLAAVMDAQWPGWRQSLS